MCSAIVDRLIRGESICEDEVFDDVSCVNDAVEQLFDLLAVDDDATTLTELHTLISNRFPIDHHRNVRAEDDDEDDHDHDEDTQNVNLQCACVSVYLSVYLSEGMMKGACRGQSYRHAAMHFIKITIPMVLANVVALK